MIHAFTYVLVLALVIQVCIVGVHMSSKCWLDYHGVLVQQKWISTLGYCIVLLSWEAYLNSGFVAAHVFGGFLFSHRVKDILLLNLCDFIETAELAGIDRGVLIRAVKILEQHGKAAMFKGASTDDDGVKFCAR